MLKLAISAALVVAGATAAPAAAQRYDDGYPGGGYPGGGYGGDRGYGGGRQTITCESVDYRPGRCPADTRGGVIIVQQIGNTPCVEGRTWGFDRGGIWVNQGCRAVFRSAGRPGGPGGYPGGPGGYPGGSGGYPGGPGGRVITCSSIQYQPARCALDVYRGAQLVEDLTNKNLCNGRTWGWDRGGIWVANGCRGRFRVY